MRRLTMPGRTPEEQTALDRRHRHLMVERCACGRGATAIRGRCVPCRAAIRAAGSAHQERPSGQETT